MQFRSKKHLDYVRRLDCMICKTNYSVQAHHLLKPWKGQRGMGMKSSDYNVVPLCHTCHRELHDMGDEHKYFLKKQDSHKSGANYSRLLWLRSPAYGDDKDE